MRQIEVIVKYALTALFFYSLFELMFSVSGVIKESPTFIVPFRINIFIVFGGILISGFAGTFFPFWNVGKYLNTQNIRNINFFRRRYKIDYYQLMGGFIGLSFWCNAENNFDIYWWLGLLFILLYIFWLTLSPIYIEDTDRWINGRYI